MLKKWLLPLVLLSNATLSLAADEEIQVYEDDLSAPGQFGVDVHNNFVVSGSGTPSYAGEQAPLHVYRLTPEFYYGLTKTVELGLYLLTTRDPEGGAHVEGSKVRVKYVPEHDAEHGFYWGANLEVGKTTTRASEEPWNGQLKGIFGYRTGPWTLAANPNLDWSLSPGGGPAKFGVDVKVAYAVTDRTQLGVESYNEWGPVSDLGPLDGYAKSLYLALDHDFGGVDLNVGVGRGLTRAADDWTIKFIVGTHF
jgi:hypothetical protein